MTFANNIHTYEGGTHETGFKTALTRVINDYARRSGALKDSDDPLSGDDVREGLTAVVSVKHPDPQFEGQTKTKLGNSDARTVVDRTFSDHFNKFLMEHPADGKLIIDKAMLASKARLAAKRAREVTRKKSGLEISNLPGKLADNTSKDPEISELFIVEGDSAGGSAKSGRSRLTQAILPIRGKILNVEKASMERILANEEIRTLFTAMGKMMRYIDSDEELQDILGQLPPSPKPDIQRYKGLGEMDASQLWETTMDPDTRRLLRVSPKDAEQADGIFEMLMGDHVEPRRKFIEENAVFVDPNNIDV